MEVNDEQWAWWMLSAPLEMAVMRRMGIYYPTAAEFREMGYEWERPLPDMLIVREELAKLQAGICDDPLAVAIHAAVMEEQDEIEHMAELSRLRDGIGTPDERADYAATREMIQSEE